MLTESTRRQFLQFCNGEIDAETFEAWACSDEELEGEIGHGAHLDLISAGYRGREAAAVRERCAALLEQHHPGNLARYSIRSILQNMLDDPAAVIPGCESSFVFDTTGPATFRSSLLASIASWTVYRPPSTIISGSQHSSPRSSVGKNRTFD